MATPVYLTVPRTARFYTEGDPTTAPELWLVLHGYGQLAQYFLRHFAPIANANRAIVAPEALSRFYLDGAYQRVGASWMTREDRHLEIQDQHAYLDALYAQLLAQRTVPLQRLVVLGFSQGATTAWRWVLQRQVAAQALIVWAGSIPTEAAPPAHLATLDLYLAYGDADPYLTADKLADIRGYLAQHQIAYREVAFAGAHTVPPAALDALLRQLGG